MMNKSAIATGIYGSTIDFADLSKSKIVLDDIAERLARIRRFNGGTKIPYSVAQHSYTMMLIFSVEGCSPRVKLLALMHDMTEAFMGDMVSPLKQFFPLFSSMEDRLFNIICEQLGVKNDFTEKEHRLIKILDYRIRQQEWYTLNDNEFIDHAGAWGIPPEGFNSNEFYANVILDTAKMDDWQMCYVFTKYFEQLREEVSRGEKAQQEIQP